MIVPFHRFPVCLPILFLIFLTSVPLTAFAKQPEPLHVGIILNQAFQANKKIKTLSYTVLMKERYGNNYIQKKTDFRIHSNPYKVYLKQYYPNQNLEILYSIEETGDKLVLNRNAFAFSTLRLDPLGNMIRKESHHSIFKADYNFLLNALEHLYRKYPEETTSVWTYNGIVRYGGIICHKITFDSPSFDFTDYTLKSGENLETISRKFKVNDYMIYENNPKYRSFDDFKPGMTIKIPTDYAKQIIIYIEKDRHIPIGVKTYDHQGLFDEYSYHDILINPEFPAREFRLDNPSYGFR